MNTKVLVIEDDLEINELLGEYLKLEKITYLQALTGKAGIHIATLEHPDVIILDLMLPDIDGMEVARTLSSQRSTCEIPIVVHSCMCQKEDKERAFASGAHLFKNKPCPPDDLLAAVAQALEWKATQPTRLPAGTVELGSAGNKVAVLKTINQMQADMLTRAELSEDAARDIREAVESLDDWAGQWNLEHPEAPGDLKLNYRVLPLMHVDGKGTGHETARAADALAGATPANRQGVLVEWKLAEDHPGLLADAFFKPAPSGTLAGGGLIGWGASVLMAKPVVAASPPAKWAQILAKTGAAKFEKDAVNRTVRFVRLDGAQLPAVTAGRVATPVNGNALAKQT